MRLPVLPPAGPRRQSSRHDTDAAPFIPGMHEEKGQDQCALEQVPPREIAIGAESPAQFTYFEF
jgi:hypothetical protein